MGQWEWQNPHPQGYDLRDVQSIDSQSILAVGEFGTIIKTADGGNSWVIQSSGTGEHLNKISLIDINNAWIAGSTGGLLHTTDAGINWALQPVGNTLNLVDVFFTDPDKGWVLGNFHSGWNQISTILHTTDGGLTWNTQFYDTSYVLQSIHFLDDNDGWAVGTKYDSLALFEEGVILHTLDGGNIWEQLIDSTFQGCTFIDVDFIDIEAGWVVGPGNIIHTGDGGASWEVQYTSGGPGSGGPSLVEVCFINSNHGWAVGSQGIEGGFGSMPIIFHTSNGGELWESHLINFDGFKYTGVIFSDTDHGWIVGTDGIILQTSNGGNTWAVISGIMSRISLSDVFFTDQLNGWSVGCNITLPNAYIVIRTSDGGETWETQLADTNFMLASVSFTDIHNGWAAGTKAGGDGIKFHTSDGGSTWEEQQTGIHRNFKSVFFTDPNNGWISGENGLILHTDNGGMVGMEETHFQMPYPKFQIQNYPNPFSNNTTIAFYLPENRQVSLKTYDLTGREIETLVSGRLEIGEHTYILNATNLHNGIYLYRLTTGDEVTAGKLMVK